MKIFICTNDNQMIGAKVAKNTIINRSQFSTNDVVILSESEIPSRKEADLRGAIDNDQNETKKNDNEKGSSAKKADDSSNDYQLSRAFDLILALDLANNYK